MKSSIILILSISMIIISCDKKEPKSNGTISVSKVEYSGCFSTGKNSLKSTLTEMKDSLYYVIENSVLILHIVRVYPCCGLLKDSVVIKDNVVRVYINDKNKDSYACNCICVFEINYSIIDFYQKNIYFKVYMKNIDNENFSLWKETKFIDGLD